MGHQISDMLISCTFQGKYCTPLNFSVWHRPQYGNCYTVFMHDIEAYIGPDYGLSLGLFVEDFEYLSMISPAAGFRVSNCKIGGMTAELRYNVSTHLLR